MPSLSLTPNPPAEAEKLNLLFMNKKRPPDYREPFRFINMSINPVNYYAVQGEQFSVL